MITVENIADVSRCVREARGGGRTIALVPTMGAMHAGHFSLVEAARRDCGFVVVSIFVNPTQFAPGEDFSSYPRTIEADLEGCRERGADAVFMPSAEEMYPGGPDAALTGVSVAQLGGTLCGRSRPRHFQGVCTVVAKLFNIVLPHRAYFGAKDFQQVRIIEQMATDLNFPVEIVRCPIVREEDGVAMSSRNAYLTPAERREAAALYESLLEARRLIREGETAAVAVIDAMREVLSEKAPHGEMDYVQIVDPRTLADMEAIEPPVLVAVAVKFGKARLIDNMIV